MVIFHSYVSLPEGKSCEIVIDGQCPYAWVKLKAKSLGFPCNLEFKSCRRKIKLLLLVTPPDSPGIRKDPKRGSNCLLASKWIGLRENLQDTIVFTIKYEVFL